MEFHVYKDKKKEYRWRLVAGNNEIIADSGEGYENREDIMATIYEIKALANDCLIREVESERNA